MSEELDRVESAKLNPFRTVTENPQCHDETAPPPGSESDSDEAEFESDVEESDPHSRKCWYASRNNGNISNIISHDLSLSNKLSNMLTYVVETCSIF